MNTDNKLDLDFAARLEDLVDGFGSGNQEGIKEALKICQEIFRCVSLAHQDQIAQAFASPLNTIKILMKLNKTLKPSPVKYEFICCTGVRCSQKGSLALLQALKEELGISPGQTSSDGKIYLRTQNCFKKCNLGPNLMINGKFYHQLGSKQVKTLLKDIQANL